MFISRKRLNDIEHRLSELESQSSSNPISLPKLSLPEISSALETALDNVDGRFEYELANADKPNPSRYFSVHLQ